MKPKYLLISWMSVAAVNVSPLLAQDEPDLKTENRLHRIYKRYNQNPTSSQKWEEALSKAQDQSYIIQKGDTLWDISETFFGDPYFWPKVWSVNKEIYNPHEILPKGAVQFVPGTKAEPPQMGLAQNVEGAEEAPEAPAKKDEEGVDLKPEKKAPPRIVDVDLSKIAIPAPLKPSKGPVRPPSSLPAYVYYRPEVNLEAEMQISKITYANPNQPMLLTHFISDDELTSAGEIVEVESGSQGVGEGAKVLVKSEGLQPGSKVTVYRPLGAVTHPSVSGRGRANQLQAELLIGEVVNSSSGVYRATVTRSASVILPGDKILLEEFPLMTPDAGGTMTPVVGTITGGQFSATRTMFGPFSIVFLNVGASQGITVGTRLPVYRNAKLRNPETLIRDNPAEIGELQVVRVGDGVATAVVVKALDDIQVGDTTNPVVE